MRDYDLIIVRASGATDVTLKPLSRRGFRFFEEVLPLRLAKDDCLVLGHKVGKLITRAFDAGICFKVWQS